MCGQNFEVALRERIQARTDDLVLSGSLKYLDGQELWLESDNREKSERLLLRINDAAIEIVNGDSTPDGVCVANGPATAWASLLAGEQSWAQATNAALGTIQITGQPEVWAWLMPIFSRLFCSESQARASALNHSADANTKRLGAHADTTRVVGRYVEIDGVQAYYESTQGDTCVSDEVNAELPVLVLHTAGRDCRQWHAVMERLGGTHRIFAPDYPGHGKSWPQSPEPCLTSLESIARWLLQFMSSVGEPRFIVAGTSVGGNLALLLAAISDRIAGSVAFQGSDHSPTISQSALELMQHPKVSLPFSSMDQALSLVGERAVPEARAIIEWSIQELSPPAQRGDLTAYTRTSTREYMADIRCPVTLVHGDQDWLATAEMIDETAGSITNSVRLRRVSLAGIGHYPHVEAPDAAAELIAEMSHFLAARRVPAHCAD